MNTKPEIIAKQKDYMDDFVLSTSLIGLMTSFERQIAKDSRLEKLKPEFIMSIITNKSDDLRRFPGEDQASAAKDEDALHMTEYLVKEIAGMSDKNQIKILLHLVSPEICTKYGAPQIDHSPDPDYDPNHDYIHYALKTSIVALLTSKRVLSGSLGSYDIVNLKKMNSPEEIEEGDVLNRIFGSFLKIRGKK